MPGLSRSEGLSGVKLSKLIVGYTFNLRTNTLTPELVDNPVCREGARVPGLPAEKGAG